MNNTMLTNQRKSLVSNKHIRLDRNYNFLNENADSVFYDGFNELVEDIYNSYKSGLIDKETTSLLLKILVYKETRKDIVEYLNNVTRNGQKISRTLFVGLNSKEKKYGWTTATDSSAV